MQIAQTSHIAHQCHVCDPRGGCLGMQLLESPGVADHLKQARRISRKAEHVFREGEEADAFYVVRSGSVKSYLVTEDGEEQVLGFYLPGDVFGLDTTETHQRMSSAITLETTSLCRFPHAYLADKSQGSNLLRITAEQMQRDHNLVLMLARKDADGRIASFLDDLACRYWSRGYSASAFLLSMSRAKSKFSITIPCARLPEFALMLPDAAKRWLGSIRRDAGDDFRQVR
jgi:CRP/FNR family transcriptional regulator